MYTFHSALWQYAGKGAWYFVSVPLEISEEIRKHFKDEEEGWGRLKVKACIGNTLWDTAIWFDTKLQCYLLPIKKEIRIKERLLADDVIKVSLEI